MDRHLSNMSPPENNKMHEKWIENIENKHAIYITFTLNSFVVVVFIDCFNVRRSFVCIHWYLQTWTLIF